MGCGALRAPQPIVSQSSTKTQLTEWYQHSKTQPPTRGSPKLCALRTDILHTHTCSTLTPCTSPRLNVLTHHAAEFHFFPFKFWIPAAAAAAPRPRPFNVSTGGGCRAPEGLGALRKAAPSLWVLSAAPPHPLL